MKKILVNFLAANLLFLPIIVFGQDIGLKNPIGVNSISELIVIVVKVVRYIAIPFVVIMIMYAGYLFLIADIKKLGGEGVDKAKDTLWWVVIGSFVILSAEMIALVLDGTFKSLR